jgi:D-3-phosphoglycerate dehydrogenase
VIITPHAAYYSEEAIRTVRDFAAAEVVRVLTGQPPLSAVNGIQVASARRAGGPRLTGSAYLIGGRGSLATPGSRVKA